MSLLKQLDRAARTCWCPSAKYPSLIASGTIAGTIDDSFISKSSLEIYDCALGSSDPQMRLLGSVESKDCFNSIAWGAKGIEDAGAMSHGLVAGGMSDGSINIWNVAGILNRSPEALLSRSETHKGQVLGLQFHPQQPNLLASGAMDGEVFVWDLANLKDPRPSKPNPQAKSSAQVAGITSIAWNKNAPQILASASEIGETTVWDLRQKRSIITIRNSARMNVRASGLAWNPSAGVQLAVCYSNYPVAEIWDLRQSMTPKVKLEGFHTGSILGLDWCPNDPSILLTVGEDARMASWNPLTGQFLHEYQSQTSGVAFDVQWAPKQPNIISTSSYDGKVNIQSINTTGPAHVPAWMTRPIGASFGFGGKLASFGLDAVAPGPAVPASGGPPSPHKAVHPTVELKQLVTDPEVLDKAAGLQQILKDADFPSFCAYKISHADDASAVPAAPEVKEGEKTIWTFMKILFEDESNQRYLLLKELGFEPPASSDIVMPQPSVPIVPNISEDDFFNQDFGASPKAGSDGSQEANGLHTNGIDAASLGAALDGIDAPEGKEADKSASSGAGAAVAGKFVEDADDKAIRQALVFGDFKAAVAKCLEVGRMADAIIFASFGPPPLWEETRATYFKQHRSPFIRDTMKCVSSQSLDEMVATSDLDSWRETLAICITYTTTSKYRALVNALGQRLEDAGRNIPAVVCFICSSNIEKAIEMWTSKIPAHISGASAASGGSALLSLHAAIEKIAVFAHATNAHQSQPSRILSIKYAEYASMLASQGELRGAFNYLSRVATPNDPNSAVLLDRIFHAESEQFVREQYPMPPFPFPVEQVQVDPTLARTLHEQAQMKLQRQQQAMAAAQARTQGHNFGAQNAGHPQQVQPQQQQQRQPQQPYGNQPQGQPQGYGQQGYGAPQQPYGAPAPAQPFQPQQPAYGAPQQPGAYGAPQQPQQQRAPFQPQQPSYGAPQPSPPHQPQPQAHNPYHQQQPGAPQHFQPQQPQPSVAQPQHGAYGGQPQGYGQQGVPQPQYQPQQPQPMQPMQPRPAVPQPAPQPFVPQQPAYGGGAPGGVQPHQPAAAAPHQPQPFVPAAAAPAPAAAAPAPFKPFQPSVPSALSPASASPAAAAEPAVQLGPAEQALIAPLEGCLTQLLGCGLKTPEQKKVAEIRSKLTDLSRRLAARDLSPSAFTELQSLVNCVGAMDFTGAQRHHLNLVKTDWANNNEWLLGLKTMLLMAKKYLEKTG